MKRASKKNLERAAKREAARAKVAPSPRPLPSRERGKRKRAGSGLPLAAGLTDPQRRFLAAYVGCCGLKAEAARLAGVAVRTHYAALQASVEYRAAFEEAREGVRSRIDAEIIRRAIDGVEVRKFDPAGQPYVEKRYSDTLLIFLAKGENPEKYGDKGLDVTARAMTAGGAAVELTVSGGTPFASSRAEQIAELRGLLEEAEG